MSSTTIRVETSLEELFPLLVRFRKGQLRVEVVTTILYVSGRISTFMNATCSLRKILRAREQQLLNMPGPDGCASSCSGTGSGSKSFGDTLISDTLIRLLVDA